jgi:hypothetical protein
LKLPPQRSFVSRLILVPQPMPFPLMHPSRYDHLRVSHLAEGKACAARDRRRRGFACACQSSHQRSLWPQSLAFLCCAMLPTALVAPEERKVRSTSVTHLAKLSPHFLHDYLTVHPSTPVQQWPLHSTSLMTTLRRTCCSEPSPLPSFQPAFFRSCVNHKNPQQAH